jgi:hypothetical protein
MYPTKKQESWPHCWFEGYWQEYSQSVSNHVKTSYLHWRRWKTFRLSTSWEGRIIVLWISEQTLLCLKLTKDVPSQKYPSSLLNSPGLACPRFIFVVGAKSTMLAHPWTHPLQIFSRQFHKTALIPVVITMSSLFPLVNLKTNQHSEFHKWILLTKYMFFSFFSLRFLLFERKESYCCSSNVTRTMSKVYYLTNVKPHEMAWLSQVVTQNIF